MNKYKRFYGLTVFFVAIAILLAIIANIIMPKVNEYNGTKTEIVNKENELNDLKNKTEIVQNKIKRIKNAIMNSQKKIYSPIESDLGNDTLFFTLYNDIIEMLHANSIKIKNIGYTYNPETDAFVKFGRDIYFVCDVDMEIVSNYVNLGKFIQDVYQYPYYIKINKIEVLPYPKDKKILVSNLSLRLYAHTSPDNDEVIETTLKGADSALPQE